MTGGPWHCGFPMRAAGGYQCGGTNEWMGFRCENCQHQQIEWGHVARDKNGLEKFMPQPKRTLIVNMCRVPNGVLCRGISHDETIFNNILYADANTAVQMLGKHYSPRGFRVHFNLPEPRSKA